MKRRIDKNKVYAFIGKITVGLTAWAITVYATYLSMAYILDNCITVYR